MSNEAEIYLDPLGLRAIQIKAPGAKNQSLNYHIQHCEIFIGDDNAFETDCIRAKASSSNPQKLDMHREIIDQPKQAPGRLRNEPGVRVLIQEETDIESKFYIEIFHHKGVVYLRTIKAD